MTGGLVTSRLARQLRGRQLEIPVAAGYRLAGAAPALAQATSGHAGGAIVLTPWPPREPGELFRGTSRCPARER